MSKPRACDHEAVLNLWNDGGTTAAKIGAIVGGRPDKTIIGIVRRARERGDQRARRRYLTFLPLQRRSGRT